MKPVQFAELEHQLGYSFHQLEVLETALTHRSVGRQAGAARGQHGGHNEVLEFLGDAVIGLVVSDLLIRAWPTATEGALSKRRAALVSAPSLARKAQTLGVGVMLTLGRGEEKSGGREKASILAGAFEALVGAVFLDGGFPAAQDVIARAFAPEIGVEPTRDDHEWKTRLQELSQRLFRVAPEYRLMATSGPDHARHFESQVAIAGVVYGSGSGGSKKLAEQEAARIALGTLERHGGGESGGASGSDESDWQDR